MTGGQIASTDLAWAEDGAVPQKHWEALQSLGLMPESERPQWHFLLSWGRRGPQLKGRQGETFELAWDAWLKLFFQQQKNRQAGGPLLRAVRGKGKKRGPIADLTCGRGRDAMLMVARGLSVHAFERHPLLAWMIERHLESEALAAWQFCLQERLTFYPHDFFSLPAGLSVRPPGQGMWQCLYYDPMYAGSARAHGRRAKARGKQELRILQELLGADEDAPVVLPKLLATAAARVVVKRPLKGADLATGVTGRYRGHSTRYDLYIPFASAHKRLPEG